MSFFNASYLGTPPWDVGHPQTEFVRLEENGEVEGSVLDVGCGTGENALFMAERGHQVCGIDSAPRAIEKAQVKAIERGIEANFRVLNVFELAELETRFDTVIDSGLFHVFDEDEHSALVRNVGAVLRTGGKYIILCFSTKETRDGGPRRISKDEILSDFSNGWEINYIKDAKFDSLIHEGGARAWLASIKRL